MTGLVLTLLLSAADVLNEDYRAVTIETGTRKSFRVPKLETVTGSSGRCIEEGLDTGENESIYLEASCEGVRTSLVWRTDRKRMHVMACAEDVEKRSPELLKLRVRVQSELKSHRSITACVRNNRIELWGWWKSETEAAVVAALQKKYGLEQLRSFVEKLPTEE